MAKKNGKDPLAHIVELMTEQVAETRLMREEVRSELFEMRGEIGGLTLSVIEVRDELRTMNGRITNVVDRVARLAPGRMVEFCWVAESGTSSWHPAVVLGVHVANEAPRGVTLDLEVFGVSPADPRRFPAQTIAGENAGCWRLPES